MTTLLIVAACLTCKFYSSLSLDCPVVKLKFVGYFAGVVGGGAWVRLLHFFIPLAHYMMEDALERAR